MRWTHCVACLSRCFLLSFAVQFSIVQIFHNLLVHLSVSGHLSRFQMVAFIGVSNNVGKLYDFNIHIYICNLSRMTLCKIGVQNLLLKIIGYSIDQVTFFKRTSSLSQHFHCYFLLSSETIYIYIYVYMSTSGLQSIGLFSIFVLISYCLNYCNFKQVLLAEVV